MVADKIILAQIKLAKAMYWVGFSDGKEYKK